MNFTVLGMWHEMGMIARAVVIILVAMSMYSLAIAVERFLTYGRGRRLSFGYIRALAPSLAQPGQLETARGIDEKFRGSPIARVVGSGISELARGLDVRRARPAPVAGTKEAQPPAGEYDIVDAVVRGMERTKDRELANLKRGLSVLATVSSSAPFVGLFGTVGGIITAFQKLADPAKGGGGIGSVSAGIAEALVTTAVGLGVAILSVWFYNFFTARVDDITVDIDETASELIDAIIKDGRAGGRLS